MQKKIMPLIPETKIYCEPFFGGGSIFWSREPSPVEIINDLHGDIINLMRHLQNPRKLLRLRKRLAATMYSRDEFCLALEMLSGSSDLFDRAWAFYVTQNQGFGGMAKSPGSWGRVFVSVRGMAMVAARWWSRFDSFDGWHKRLARAQIDNRDALEVIRYWDTADTTFYLDPPYVASTRKGGKYKHECTDDFHAKLVDTIIDIKGYAVLSGYDSKLYSRLTDAGWIKTEVEVSCAAAGRTRGSGLRGKGSVSKKQKRTDCIWQNPKAVKHFESTGGLFDEESGE